MTDYKDLVRQRTSILGSIEEVEKFSTWWNNNLATVINYYGGYYRVFLLVYDPVHSTWSPAVFPVDSFCIYWGEKGRGRHEFLSDARSEANWLRGELTYSGRKGYNNPILVIHPNSDRSRSFSEFIKEPYVKEIPLPDPYDTEVETVGGLSCACRPTCDCSYCNCHDDERVANIEHVYHYKPSDYLKPLDIVWVKRKTLGNEYHHVGVYTGDEEICHYTGGDKKQYKSRVKITNWGDFVDGCVDREVFAFHPVIPFKHYSKSTQEIEWAKDSSYWEGKYCLANNNCEHRVNSFVYGINHSKQVQERPNASIDNCKYYRDKCQGGCQRGIANDGKNSINLSSEISKTNNQLNKSTGYWSNKISNEYQAKTVVLPKDCKIM